MTYNTGLNVKEGETKMIGQFQLSASDIDSDDTKVTYKIIKTPSAVVSFTDNPIHQLISPTGNVNGDWKVKVTKDL